MAKRGAMASMRRGTMLGCGLQAVVLGMLPVVMGAATGLVLVFDISRSWSPVVLGGAFGSWFLLSGLVVGGVMGRVVSRRNRALDAAFGPLGLRPVRVGWVHRGFVGTSAGRPVHAWFSKGPQLELYVDCRSGRRVGVGADNPLARGVGRVMGKDAIPVSESLRAWSDDADWTRAWLARPGVSDHLQALCDALVGARAQVVVGPASVMLHLRYFALNEWTGDSDLSTERIAAWVVHLVALADSVEALPAGMVAEGGMETSARTDRGALWRKSMGCALLVVAGSVVLTLVLVAALLLFGG